MSEIIWTESQKAAINVEAPKILISAAAGSGKSTVLTERIISSITSEKKGFDISKILAVTFTKASAEDLKAKISQNVRSAVLKDPNNKRLGNQLIKLSSAKISTIHGLCFNLIKNHFQMLGLNASMRVADETESAALRTEVLEELLESAYAGYFKPIPDFSYFAENFISERDDSLIKILTDVYEKIKNVPNGFYEWKEKIGEFTAGGDFGNTSFGKIVLFNLSLFIDYAILICRDILNDLGSDENYKEKYLPSFKYDLKFLLNIQKITKEGNYDKVADIISSYEPIKLKSMPASLKTDKGEYARMVVKPYIKDSIKKFKEDFFENPDYSLKVNGEQTSKIANALLNFLEEFDRKFTDEKLKRSVLDFNDLEQYAVKLLYNENGTISENAKRISASFDEIYVDEYQDVNPLQNKIFQALSINCPIFMVGDIKQSIYRFRGAEPSIFSDYHRNFHKYQKNIDKYENSVTITLSDNFRSAFNITEFVNTVSDALFLNNNIENRYSYRIPYSKEDRLFCNSKADAPEVNILIADYKKSDLSVNKSVTDENNILNDIQINTDRQDPGSVTLEAEMIANKISSLISSGVNTDDIAILLRGTKSDAPVFESALKKRNIPTSTDKGSKLFDAPEIQLALCLLNCIDNPYRDIFLAGALRSPIFGFTFNDLIKIRQSKNNASSLFDAIKEYTLTVNFQKGIFFLDFLSRMRMFASKNTVDRTLWQIYTETAFFTLIYDGGRLPESVVKCRRSNLLKLHEIAKSFSSFGKSDLYSFIDYIRVMLDSDNVPSASEEGTGVKIMSIHHSKGLEIDYCFVARCSRAFSTETSKKSVVIDPKYGIAMRIKDSLRLTSADTLYRRALLLECKINEAEEEMRLLYVALSRAKTALYISGTVKDFLTIERNCYHAAAVHHPMVFYMQNSYLKWILTALKCKTDLSPCYSVSVFSPDEIYKDFHSGVPAGSVLDTKMKITETEEEIYSTLKKRFDYVYPHKTASFIPSKISVSKLYPKILDDLEEDVNYFDDSGKFILPDFEHLIHPEDNLSAINEFTANGADEQVNIPDNSPKMKIPDFLLGTDSVSSAEKGTATHIFMQFCDFENTEKNGISAEIERLTKKRFILPSHAKLINTEEVKVFFLSDIYKMIKEARYVQREYRFNVKFPASNFTENPHLIQKVADDYIFVQGVIDCYFKDKNGNIYLLDYKTDRVPESISGTSEKEKLFFNERHGRQLSYYKKALEKLTGQVIYKTLIYSFSLGKTIEIKD